MKLQCCYLIFLPAVLLLLFGSADAFVKSHFGGSNLFDAFDRWVEIPPRDYRPPPRNYKFDEDAKAHYILLKAPHAEPKTFEIGIDHPQRELVITEHAPYGFQKRFWIPSFLDPDSLTAEWIEKDLLQVSIQRHAESQQQELQAKYRKKLLRQLQAERREQLLRQKQAKRQEEEEAFRQREAEHQQELLRQREEEEELLHQREEAERLRQKQAKRQEEEAFRQREAEIQQELLRRIEAEHQQELLRQREEEERQELLRQREEAEQRERQAEYRQRLLRQLQAERREQLLRQKQAERQKAAALRRQRMKQAHADHDIEILVAEDEESTSDADPVKLPSAVEGYVDTRGIFREY